MILNTIWYTLMLYMMVLGLSVGVSMLRKEEGFSFNIFMGSIAIGITILIWSESIPTYMIILPVLLMVGMIFSDKTTGGETT